MKLKDVFSVTHNKANKQSIWNPKKRVLKNKGITEEKLLNTDLKKIIGDIKIE